MRRTPIITHKDIDDTIDRALRGIDGPYPPLGSEYRDKLDAIASGVTSYDLADLAREGYALAESSNARVERLVALRNAERTALAS